ncbi:hypothetical protein [Thioalkalivibrio sp. ALJ2]|uniref:hypothetical protein n=1 Tax=Thioalkalivibrio sp. ALJ2 TaxID=1261622 RepID=UPI0003713450|nr:hypothetical protein [Thioalkalivibrio sp. ALJ2]
MEPKHHSILGDLIPMDRGIYALESDPTRIMVCHGPGVFLLNSHAVTPMEATSGALRAQALEHLAFLAEIEPLESLALAVAAGKRAA